MKKILADRKINFYTIDGIQIGKEIGLGGRINTILQSAFLKIADIMIYLQGSNLFSLDNIRFADPELLSASYTSMRTFTAGLKFNF